MNGRQKAILAWAIETFGPVAANIDERAARLVEEAIEAVQSVGLPLAVVQKIAERVYSKPLGDPAREIGAVALTLEAFAERLHYRVEFEADREFHRICAIPKEVFAQRHAAKVAAGTSFPNLHATNGEPAAYGGSVPGQAEPESDPGLPAGSSTEGNG